MVANPSHSAAGPPATVLRAVLDSTLVTAVSYVDTVGSTNTELLAGPAEPGTMLIADQQTAGRGRRGRHWFAPPGTSLMFSLALGPRLGAAARSLLTLVVGTALLEATRSIPALRAAGLGLKWPNDLLIDDVKTAGILAEGHGDLTVVGVGVNVDWRGVERPDGIEATSLCEAAAQPIDRWDLLRRLVESMAHGITAAEQDPGGVVSRYTPWCVTVGREVQAMIAHQAVTGTAVGLGPDGHLRIRREDGREVRVSAGEVRHLR